MSSQSSHDFVSEINVTPFVDVMLVLLIIFMVTAPLMTEGLDVSLPQVKEAEVLPDDQDKIMLTLKASGEIFLADQPVTLEELETQFANTMAQTDKRIFFQADKDVSYGLVVKVMALARTAGIKNIGMVTVPLEDSPSASATGNLSGNLSGNGSGTLYNNLSGNFFI